LNCLFFFTICLHFVLIGCDTEGGDYHGDNREFAAGIKPEILDAKLIDEYGNEVETRVIDGNRVIMPKVGQKIGFEIQFRTSKKVTAEIIVSQYTQMNLIPQPEPVYCEETECPDPLECPEPIECPDPEKGEISYYGEEIFSGTPYQGPQRYDIPPQPEGEGELDETDYHINVTSTYNEHYLKIRYYYTVDHLGYERMFRFQVEDSDGYISRHLVIYTKIPL